MVDSTTTAGDVHALRLTEEEFERFRAEDMAKIKAMGVKIRNLQAAAKHEIEVNAPINAQVKDTIVIRNTLPMMIQTVRMSSDNPYVDVKYSEYIQVTR